MKQKIYKGCFTINIRMIPSDPTGSLDESFFLITEKFINTISLLPLVCSPVIGMGRRMSLFNSCYINKYQEVIL